MIIKTILLGLICLCIYIAANLGIRRLTTHAHKGAAGKNPERKRTTPLHQATSAAREKGAEGPVHGVGHKRYVIVAIGVFLLILHQR